MPCPGYLITFTLSMLLKYWNDLKHKLKAECGNCTKNRTVENEGV